MSEKAPYLVTFQSEKAPYLATFQVEIWAWEYERATEVFKNLCDDVSRLNHRFSGGSHAFPPPVTAELVRNPERKMP